MNTETLQKILALVDQKPGLKASAIAKALGLETTDLHKALYGPLKGKCWQDNKYNWFVTKNAPAPAVPVETNAQGINSPIARLCRYYLACLAQDDDGDVSVFAYNKSGDLDYCELPALPLSPSADPFQSENAKRLMGKLRSDKGRLAIYLGYPCATKRQKSKTSKWEGSFVEPLFLFPIEVEGAAGTSPQIERGFPLLNRAPLKRFSNADTDNILEELIQLERELGLTDSDDVPALDELALRLYAIRPEWPWKEAIDPTNLSTVPALSQVALPGIYNRAVLVIAERSPFTQGLEAELKQLAVLSTEQLKGSVLGRWIEGAGLTTLQKIDAQSVIEVLPLNSEQRQAIQQSMASPLTIITGPPGTGKSQVVTDLLINAAWYGQRVIFASKNNKAVDVVETRVNDLGPRPFLLRVGPNQYQNRLAAFLLGLLGSSATKEDNENFDEAKTSLAQIEAELESLTKSEDSVVTIRNEVDQLERTAEPSRITLAPAEFAASTLVDRLELERTLEAFRETLAAATRSSQGFLNRMFWRFVKNERFAKLKSAANDVERLGKLIGIRQPLIDISDESIAQWYRFSGECLRRKVASVPAKSYFDALRRLQGCRSLEDIAAERASLLKRLADCADRLWRNWLRMQPSRLSQKDRQDLQKYSSVLKMVMETGSDEKLSPDVYKKYRELFPKVAHLLPCWAVTSLSARGRVPFEAGSFDLVVFDEASQCDIASALPLLYRAKRAVVIGDPMQLSHISAVPKGQDQQLLQKFGLLDDFPHWAYSYNSLFGLASGFVGSDDVVNLRDHHRSHADIIEFSNTFFYEGRLRVATRYDHLNLPQHDRQGVRWIDVPGNVWRPAAGGAVNEAEAAGVIDALRDLLVTNGYRGSIGVVSAFRAQANHIRELANTASDLAPHLANAQFLVDTVHKFQGDERDVMIFSPVVAEGISPGAMSFLRNNGNLFNVAITRARAQLIVVGDVRACSHCDIGYLAEFARYVTNLSDRDGKAVPTEANQLGAEYPAVSAPEQVSDWEKIFYKALYSNGIRALPQYQVEKYALDFAVISGGRKLNVEIDGERYHRNWTGELCRRDQLRNQRMIELGWGVMRFWVYEIRDDIDGCVERVQRWLSS